jgi:ABC-type transport system involved in cytochrome bd biosynthesis fused ATPase/permease subunit
LVALTGPSGSGKTTLIDRFCGLLNEEDSYWQLNWADDTWLQRLGLAHLLQRQGGLDAPLALAQDPFSGGEIHRLGLLRAWLRDKPIEVLDEPTAFLDAKAAEQVRSVIRERAEQRGC